MKRVWAVSVFLLLTACPETGVVCKTGTGRCGNGCADFSSDSRNCGACGQTCLAGQICASGACRCGAGTVLCDGQCAALETDPRNCGACGQRCGAGNPVCENKTCKAACSASSMRCNDACIDVQSDRLNCGACGNACPDQQSCRSALCTWDMVAACFTSGQVRGLSKDAVEGPLQSMGTGPLSLASWGPVLLVADNLDNRLLQANLGTLQAYAEFNATGRAPNHILTDPPFVYAVNSVGHTLQILRPLGDAGCPPVVTPDAGCGFVPLADGGAAFPQMADGGCFFPAVSDGGCADALQGDGGLGPYPLEDGGCFTVPPPVVTPPQPCFQGVSDAGLKLATIGELDFGPNTFPQAAAKANGALWVPLLGGLSSATAGAGQKVAKVDISDPFHPRETARIDLTTLDLKAFDGGNPAPRPYGIVELNGTLYVVLSNLDADTYAPEGPGLLATINPASNATAVIDLGVNDCLNPVAVLRANGKLFVSCAGAAIYSPSFALIATDRSGVVMLDPVSGARATWSPTCVLPPDAGCLPVLPSRLAVMGSRVFLGDQNGGRIFTADIVDGGLVEHHGYRGDAGVITACGIGPFGYANVADILVLP